MDSVLLTSFHANYSTPGPIYHKQSLLPRSSRQCLLRSQFCWCFCPSTSRLLEQSYIRLDFMACVQIALAGYPCPSRFMPYILLKGKDETCSFTKRLREFEDSCHIGGRSYAQLMWKLVWLACNYLGLAGIQLIISILCNTPYFYDLMYSISLFQRYLRV
jgi:hypothetical protein